MKSLIKIIPKSKIFRKTNLIRWLLIPGIILLFYSCQSIDSSSKGDKKTRNVRAKEQSLGFDIYSIPVFCAHEHWGSIDAIGGGYVSEFHGFYSDVYAGATPSVSTSIWDLIFDPYFGGMIRSAGTDYNALARTAGYTSYKMWWEANPQAALENFKTSMFPLIMNGTIQCIIRGINKLYGVDLFSFNLEEWQKADSLVNANYSNIFTWYQDAMKQANFSELIRPVQPEFYLLEESAESKANELSFTHTILRVDPFLDFWNIENKRRDNLAKVAGVDPIDAKSWRAFIKFYTDLAEKNQTTGIKQLQAYTRDLDFKFHKDEEVKFRGNLNNEEIKVFQDWVMNEFCRIANEKRWVHQIHVGTNNLKNSSPLPLEDLGKRYPQMKIVMLHCWPFFEEAAFLAKYRPNFYIDNCWTPILSPEFFSQALDTYLNFVPYSKIMCSNDATSIEMAVGSSLFIREILEEKLSEQKALLNLTDEQLRTAALDMLQNNAVRVYEIGTEVK
jgi:predicted TIM-barrel fold metal-dependent hydrolase